MSDETQIITVGNKQYDASKLPPSVIEALNMLQLSQNDLVAKEQSFKLARLTQVTAQNNLLSLLAAVPEYEAPPEPDPEPIVKHPKPRARKPKAS
tara:strand:- start:805 stop:1089 length:285 start_codon:yes stop_codon:yes gene_type:complete